MDLPVASHIPRTNSSVPLQDYSSIKETIPKSASAGNVRTFFNSNEPLNELNKKLLERIEALHSAAEKSNVQAITNNCEEQPTIDLGDGNIDSEQLSQIPIFKELIEKTKPSLNSKKIELLITPTFFNELQLITGNKSVFFLKYPNDGVTHKKQQIKEGDYFCIDVKKDTKGHIKNEDNIEEIAVLDKNFNPKKEELTEHLVPIIFINDRPY